MRFAILAGGFDRCVAYLEGLAESKSDLMVGMEATGHYWLPLFCRLQDAGYAVVVINPIRTDAMRRFKEAAREDGCDRLRARSRDDAMRRLRAEQARRRIHDGASPAHAPAPRTQRKRPPDRSARS